MKLENSFEVPASPERTWAFMNDVPRVVPCMPGAELTDVVSDHEWKARMKVKLGPISMIFLTDVVQVESDEGARRTAMTADAKEQKGRGGANATITSTLSAVAEGTRVDIVTDVQMQGSVAQFGSGVVGKVAGQMVKRFAANIAAELAAEAPGS